MRSILNSGENNHGLQALNCAKKMYGETSELKGDPQARWIH